MDEDLELLYSEVGTYIEQSLGKFNYNFDTFSQISDNDSAFQMFKDSVGNINDCPTTKKEFLKYLIDIFSSQPTPTDIANALENMEPDVTIEKIIDKYNIKEVKTYNEKNDLNYEIRENIEAQDVISFLSKTNNYKEVNNEIRYWKITDDSNFETKSIPPTETFISIDYNNLYFRKLAYYWLFEYIYFGKVLSWIDPSLLQDEFKQMYFFWALKNDPNANQNEIVLTRENFYKYDVQDLPDYGISQKQLLTYFIKEYIPEIKILGNFELYMSNDKLFQFLKSSRFYHPNKNFYKDVIQCIDEKININIVKIDKTVGLLVNSLLENNNELVDKYRFIKKMDELSLFIISIKTELLYTKLSLAKKMQSIINKYSKDPKRFKWQKICSKVESKFNINELRGLASNENIPNFLTKTKVELCGDFALKYTEMYDEQMKLVNSDKCNNKEFGTILGTELKDVPTEFFFTFTDNGQLYCTDIRDLNTQFSKDDFKNPWTRSNLPDIVVKNSQDFYNKLKETVNNFLDKDEPEVPKLSKSSELSTKISAVLSALRYPATAQKFIDADDSKIKEFSADLVTNQVLTRTEERQVNSQLDSFTKKIVLLQILQTKINNDPLENGAPTTSFRGELEDSYNRNFSAGTESETET